MHLEPVLPCHDGASAGAPVSVFPRVLPRVLSRVLRAVSAGVAAGILTRALVGAAAIFLTTALVAHSLVSPRPCAAQQYGEPDRGEPGDPMIQAWLAAEAARLQDGLAADLKSADDWAKLRPRYREEYLYMLGLWPLPERTPLETTVTGVLERGDFAVEKLHYQSRPGLYVTANLYRPAAVVAGERLPAVLYVCGHSGRGRSGNKTAFQSHGMWFARHGYVCLAVDTLQLGEIASIHHGTYRDGRWWWHSRGYTPAGVECWNGVRGIDYLQSRPDVDPERIGVTGISGGGAATFWIAAADERVKVAIPVSGMADLPSYVSNRVINGHCDCMFLYNTFRWPWARIAALIEPRPLLFTNSHEDPIFPMDANERVIAHLERLYALHGAGDRVDAFVSLGGHAYRRDIRKAAFRWMNIHLKGDPREVIDSEVDLVEESGGAPKHPIAPEDLRVFPRDEDIPRDQKNTTIDRLFVAQAEVRPPEAGKYREWRAGLLSELKRVAFRSLPDRVPPATCQASPPTSAPPTSMGPPAADSSLVETEPGIRLALRLARRAGPPQHVQPGEAAQPGQASQPGQATQGPVASGPGSKALAAPRIILAVLGAEDFPQAGAAAAAAPPVAFPSAVPSWLESSVGPQDIVYTLAPRGVGPTRWTRKNPPNCVERSQVLLGATADAGRIRDVASVARCIRQTASAPAAAVWVAGRGATGVLAAYAGLLEDEIAGAIVFDPPSSHMDEGAPQLLNVLRVCDVPEALGMIAPRPIEVRRGKAELVERVRRIYEAAGAGSAVVIRAE